MIFAFCRVSPWLLVAVVAAFPILIAAAPQNDAASLFDAEIAPLLARHCLECHDSVTRKGKLDLSQKDHAMAGGKNGIAIVPGKSAESALWEAVHSGEMPEDRPSLSKEEKDALRRWIDAGAVWTSDTIDPLAHKRDPRAAVQWIWRLTAPEYIETVRSAVGVEIAREAQQLLPKDARADGFRNTAYNLQVDLAHVEAYAKLAEIVVSRMDPVKFAAGFGGTGDLAEGKMRELIASIGKWLLRGPLDEYEVSSFLRIPKEVAKDGGDYREAVSWLLEAMLQSPRFVYRIENHRGDGQVRRLSDHELASRLSYMVWGAPPDQELMRAADAGELSDRAKAEAQVTRMLGDRRAVQRSRQFADEWLDLERLENMRPNEKRFPKWDKQLAADMREETLAFFEEIAWKEKRPLADLLNAQLTFATPRLAKHYGLDRKLAADGAEEAQKEALPRPKTNGLQVLYTFEESDGGTVADEAKAGDPLDLKFEKSSAAKWTPDGLAVNGSAWLATDKPPKRWIAAVKNSNEFTLEAWITPADRNQKGPARIVTLSSGASQRNFTLGQEGDKFDVRLRSTKKDANGLPSLSSPGGAVKTGRMHVVQTRDAAGKVKLYLDGKEAAAGEATGDLSNWDEGFRLGLGNESTNDRPWRGTFHRVALYSRALNAEEVRKHHVASVSKPADGNKLVRYDLSTVPARGGLLTQGSLLTIGGDDASMVTRGLFVLHDLLYSAVGSAPPGTDTRPVPPKAGQSRRAVAETRIANVQCVSCHSRFEPLAFGLEKFDGLGGYHETDEHGNQLREDGEILFPGEKEPTRYQTSAELMDLLAKSNRVRKNITRKLTQFSIGRPLVESDARIVDEIHAVAQQGGGTYSSLIKAIALSDLVGTTRTETILAKQESKP